MHTTRLMIKEFSNLVIFLLPTGTIQNLGKWKALLILSKRFKDPMISFSIKSEIYWVLIDYLVLPRNLVLVRNLVLIYRGKQKDLSQPKNGRKKLLVKIGIQGMIIILVLGKGIY